ncbi:chorion class A protein L11-like [Vanessa cardui]|uniref:chorion class A protein L11-like n=1 Tax=Vanessa cardui TaxID=171605 RepID=UPI001F140D6E|nr:chorion class A protein L11-like [Vanessa cardui]
MYKAVLLVCAMALAIQSIAGACIGNGLGPFGNAGPLGLNEPFGLAGPFGLGRPLGLAEPFGLGETCGLGPLGAPYGAYGAYGLGYGIGNYAGPFRAGYGYGALL